MGKYLINYPIGESFCQSTGTSVFWLRGRGLAVYFALSGKFMSTLRTTLMDLNEKLLESSLKFLEQDKYAVDLKVLGEPVSLRTGSMES